MSLQEGLVELLIEKSDDSQLNALMEDVQIEIIRRRGERDGRNAGSWVFDGNTQPVTIMLVKEGIKNGDPEILDKLPEPRVGGEMADEPTWDDILKEELGVEFINGTDELYLTYSEAFSNGVEAEVMAYGE